MEKNNIAFKYRLYPTSKQRDIFAKTFGSCRKVFNLMLNDKIEYYRLTGKSKTFTPAMYKEDYPFLKEVDSLALANEQLHLQTAFKNFFTNKKSKFPKFKSKKHDRDSYTTNFVNGNIAVNDKTIKLPKIGLVKARVHRLPDSKYTLKAMTISKEKDNTYYVSVLYEYDMVITPVDKIVSHIGLDYKSDGLFAASNGIIADMPHFYRNSLAKLSKEQRKLSRMTFGSNNYNKQKYVIAKISRHIANQRKDFLHKLSSEITNQYDLISVEDINMQWISRKSYNLGKATYDNGFGMFVNMLSYKQKNKGHYLVKVDKYFPSSQLCQCGYKNSITKNLAVKTVTCPKCGSIYDRDINAAINIDNEGYRIFIS